MSPLKRNPKAPKGGKKVPTKNLSPGAIAKQLLESDEAAEKEREEEEETTAPALVSG